MNILILSTEKRVEDTKNLINDQMDEIEECQTRLADENNKLYTDIDSLKLEIIKLQ